MQESNLEVTERAQRILDHAWEEARRLNRTNICTEHILLGLIWEGSGVAANVLENLDVDLEKVRAELVKRIVLGEPLDPRDEKPGMTPLAARVLQFAAQDVFRLQHHRLGSEHLLLGLLQEERGLAAQVLVGTFGLKVDHLRKEIAEFLGSPPPIEIEQSPEPAVVMYPGFSEEAYAVMDLARDVAARVQQDSITPEHLLVALGLQTPVLQEAGLDAKVVLDELRSILPPASGKPAKRNLDLSSQSVKVLNLAWREAPSPHGLLSGRHFLVAIVIEGQSNAAKILMAHGATPDELRKRWRPFGIF